MKKVIQLLTVHFEVLSNRSNSARLRVVIKTPRERGNIKQVHPRVADKAARAAAIAVYYVRAKCPSLRFACFVIQAVRAERPLKDAAAVCSGKRATITDFPKCRPLRPPNYPVDDSS